MDSLSTPPLLANQLPRAKAISPDTWQTNKVLPHRLTASLGSLQVYLGKSFENKCWSGCPMRLERDSMKESGGHEGGNGSGRGSAAEITTKLEK